MIINIQKLLTKIDEKICSMFGHMDYWKQEPFADVDKDFKEYLICLRCGRIKKLGTTKWKR